MRSTQGVPQKLKVIYLSHNIPKIILSRQNFQFRPAINLSRDYWINKNTQTLKIYIKKRKQIPNQKKKNFIQLKCEKFETNVKKKFGWDFDIVPEDEEPVVVVL